LKISKTASGLGDRRHCAFDPFLSRRLVLGAGCVRLLGALKEGEEHENDD
jgi:hypothetical protein